MAKVSIGKRSEFEEGKMKAVKLQGHDDIVVTRIGGKIYAMRGLCNHEGGPLAEGEIDGKTITCPWHGSQWDVTTGKNTWFTMKLDDEPTYSVTEDGEELFIEI